MSEDSSEVLTAIKNPSRKTEVVVNNKRNLDQFSPELKREASVAVAVRKGGKAREAGNFTVKEFFSKAEAERYTRCQQYLKENGFPVPTTVRNIEGKNQVLVTDLTENGTKKVLPLVSLYKNFQVVDTVINPGAVVDTLRAVARRADELGININVIAACNLVVDQNNYAKIVIAGEWGVAFTKRQKREAVFNSSTNSADEFIEKFEKYKLEKAAQQLRQEQKERWRKEAAEKEVGEKLAKEYLLRHFEPEPQVEEGAESAAEAPENVLYETATEVRVDSDDSLRVLIDGLTIAYTFQPLDAASLTDRESKILTRRGGAENFRLISDFQVDDSTGHLLTLKGLLPRGTKIYYRPVNVGPKVDDLSASDEETGAIYLLGDLRTLYSLTVLAHEAGHMDYNSKYPDRLDIDTVSRKALFNREIGGRGGSLSDAQAVLEDERSSWSYALSKLRPFINRNRTKLTRENVSRMLRKVALETYSNSIRFKVRGRLMQSSVPLE